MKPYLTNGGTAVEVLGILVIGDCDGGVQFSLLISLEKIAFLLLVCLMKDQFILLLLK